MGLTVGHAVQDFWSGAAGEQHGTANEQRAKRHNPSFHEMVTSFVTNQFAFVPYHTSRIALSSMLISWELNHFQEATVFPLQIGNSSLAGCRTPAFEKLKKKAESLPILQSSPLFF